MAFMAVFVSIFISGLIWKGQALRKYSLISGETEDGLRVLSDRSDVDLTGAGSSEDEWREGEYVQHTKTG